MARWLIQFSDKPHWSTSFYLILHAVFVLMYANVKLPQLKQSHFYTTSFVQTFYVEHSSTKGSGD